MIPTASTEILRLKKQRDANIVKAAAIRKSKKPLWHAMICDLYAQSADRELHAYLVAFPHLDSDGNRCAP
jgi:hypothetical protein